MNSMEDLRADLSTLKRKGHVSGPEALFLAKVLDRIEALEQQGRSAIRPGFFGQEAPTEHPQSEQALCPVCVTRREWAVGSKV